jgi:integrase/recombinase XerC
LAFLASKSGSTAEAYFSDLEQFRAWAGAKDKEQAVEALLSRGHGEANIQADNYKNYMLDRGLAPNTVNRRLSSLRSFIRYTQFRGWTSWLLTVESVKSCKYRDTAGPGRENIAKMLDQAESRGDAKGARDYAILRLMYDLGLRRGEIARLDMTDIDLVAGTVQVLGKGRRELETLTLPAPTVEAIKSWLHVKSNDHPALFTNLDRAGQGDGRLSAMGIYCIVRNLGRQIGVKVSPNGIRHTAITEACIFALANGISLEEVLDYARLTDVNTMMIYVDRERNVQGHLAAGVAASV